MFVWGVCVWCSSVYHLKMPGYLVQTEDRLMCTESLDVGHKLKTTAWWGDQSAPVCSPHTIKTGSVWMFQRGESEKRRPPPPIVVGLLMRLVSTLLSPDLMRSNLHIVPQCDNIFVLSVSFLTRASQWSRPHDLPALLHPVYLEASSKWRQLCWIFFLYSVDF